VISEGAQKVKPVRIKLVLLLVCLALMGFYSASVTMLWDRDEPRFARAAVEMVRTGDVMVPRFDGQLRPDKPPLVYWLMMPWIGALGATDLAVRIPSILATLITALATFHIGKTLGGEDVGLRAAAVGALMPLPMLLGSAATADATMLAGITVSMAILVDRALHGARRLHLPLLCLALSWAMLAKGPVGPCIFLLACASASIAGRGKLDLGRRWWGVVAIALLVSISIFLCWAIPANEATGGELARIGIGRHLIERSTSALESHGGSGWSGWILGLPFYLPVLLLGAAPISALLVPIVARRRQLFGGDGAGVLLASLILPTLLLMTLVATKLPHYILATFPGIAVTVALCWTRVERGEVDENLLGGVAGRLGRWIAALMLVVTAIAFVVVLMTYSGSRTVMICVAAGLITTAVLTVNLKPGVSFVGWKGPGFLAAATGFCLLAMLTGLGQLQSSWQLGPQIARVIDSSVAPDAPFVVDGYHEPSLVFALDRDPLPSQRTVPPLIDEYPGGVSQWAQSKDPTWLLITRQKRERSGLEAAESGCERLWSNGDAGTLNYSTGKTVSLELWYNSGS
jgi:4-amino-4-deoxy-L-arabinose transferase-like glycosyltransferase